jgi:hypothetical protein
MLSSLSTTENPISIPAECRESLRWFPISRLPQSEAHLAESLIERERSLAGSPGLRYHELLQSIVTMMLEDKVLIATVARVLDWSTMDIRMARRRVQIRPRLRGRLSRAVLLLDPREKSHQESGQPVFQLIANI